MTAPRPKAFERRELQGHSGRHKCATLLFFAGKLRFDDWPQTGFVVSLEAAGSLAVQTGWLTCRGLQLPHRQRPAAEPRTTRSLRPPAPASTSRRPRPGSPLTAAGTVRVPQPLACARQGAGSKVRVTAALGGRTAIARSRPRRCSMAKRVWGLRRPPRAAAGSVLSDCVTPRRESRLAQ